MRSISWIWWIILLSAVALPAIPATRDTIRGQIGLLFPPAPIYMYWQSLNFNGEVIQRRQEEIVARAEANYPQDWKVILGAGLLTSDGGKQIARLKLARELAPKEYQPAVLAALVNSRIKYLHYRRDEDLGYGRPRPRSWQESFLTPRETRPVRELLAQWRQLEPDNAAPQALLAWLDFGERRDAAGLKQLKAAAQASRLDFHTSALTEAQIKTLQAGGRTAFDAAFSGSLEVLFPQLAHLREVARVAAYKGYEAQAAGKNEEAIATWLSVMHLGRKLRYQGRFVLECLVGDAIQAIGTAPVYKWSTRWKAKEQGLKPVYPLTDPIGRYNQGDIYQGISHDFFLQYAGPAATAEALAGLKQIYEFRELNRQFSAQEENDRVRSLLLLRPGLLMLMEMLLLVLLGFLAWLLARRPREPENSLKAFWAIVFCLFALLPTWIYTGVAASQSPYDLRRLNPLGLHYSPLYILGFCALLAGLGIWLNAKQRPTFGATFVGLIRQLVPICLLLLVVSYAALTARTAVLRSKVVKQIEASITQGELAQLHREHPELFRPPAKAGLGSDKAEKAITKSVN